MFDSDLKNFSFDIKLGKTLMKPSVTLSVSTYVQKWEFLLQVSLNIAYFVTFSELKVP